MPERYATRRVYAAAMALAELPFALVIGFMFLFIAPEEGYHWPGGVVFSIMVFITLIVNFLTLGLHWPAGIVTSLLFRA